MPPLRECEAIAIQRTPKSITSMHLRFTLRRMMIGVVAAAAVLVVGMETHYRLHWSWRAVGRPKEWAAIKAMGRSFDQLEASLAKKDGEWRASRMRIAAEYRAEAARLRARAASERDLRRADDYDRFAEHTIQTIERGFLYLDKRGPLQRFRAFDFLDTVLLGLACFGTIALILILRSRRAGRNGPPVAALETPHARAG